MADGEPGRWGEFTWIETIRRRQPPHPRVLLGIGDDTAVVDFPQPAQALYTVDMLLEHVHFEVPPATWAQVGRKALAVNLSDIAAMGGVPLAAVISVALRQGTAWDVGNELYAGLEPLAAEFGVAVVGGDTNTWDGPVAISVTLLGETRGRGPVCRHGAQAGDVLFVTGELGGSLLGKHLDFTPRLREAALLQRTGTLRAMIDISDGLAADLHHILDASGVGAVLDADAIPLSAAAHALSARDGRSPLEHALADGEDFELLFAVPAAAADCLAPLEGSTTCVTRIGTIVADRGAWLERAGHRTPLPAAGWQHPF